MRAKSHFVSLDGGHPRRNYRLFRSVFPEVNKQMLPYFLKTRTKTDFVMLLAAWRLGWVAEALFWIKRKLRELKAGRS